MDYIDVKNFRVSLEKYLDFIQNKKSKIWSKQKNIKNSGQIHNDSKHYSVWKTSEKE